MAQADRSLALEVSWRTIGKLIAAGALVWLWLELWEIVLVFLVAAAWMLIAGIIAVRQALDYRSTGRAVAVVLIGWTAQWLIVLVLLSLLRRPAF